MRNNLLLVAVTISSWVGVTTTLKGQTVPFRVLLGGGLPGSSDGSVEALPGVPTAMAADQSGTIYFTNNGAPGPSTTSGRIGRITADTFVIRFAGVSNPAQVDFFKSPHGITVDAGGTLYVTDAAHTIRKVTSDGVVSVFAGSTGLTGTADGSGSAARFNLPRHLTIDASGNIFVADTGNHTIRKITPAAVVTTFAGSPGAAGSANGSGAAARFNGPDGIAIDSAGNLIVSERGNHSIRRITPAGNVSLLAGLPGVSGNANGAGTAARFNSPGGLAVDGAGYIYLADTGNHTIRKIDAGGNVTTVAGLAGSSGFVDGSGATARFNSPTGILVDGTGDLLVADYGNFGIRRVNGIGEVSRFVGSSQGTTTNYAIRNGTLKSAKFNFPQGIAIRPGGGVYVADSNNSTIRKIIPTTAPLLVPFVSETLAGLAGNSGSANGTGSSARFNSPIGVAADSAGNVYVGDTFNHTIRKITPAGVVSTFAGVPGSSGNLNGNGPAARFNLPAGVAVDNQNNVYVADSANHVVRKITPAGDVTTLAGLAGSAGSADGQGSAARFNGPLGVAVDAAGYVVVADTGNHTIRRITPSGFVTKVAGRVGVAGDLDGTGNDAFFNSPQGVAVDRLGYIYVGDVGNPQRAHIRKITPTGVVTKLYSPQFISPGYSLRGVAVDELGILYVADASRHEISQGIRPAEIISPLQAKATLGQQFVYQFETNVATSKSVGALPPGLTYRSDLSAIVGTPTAIGSFTIQLSASGPGGDTVAGLALTVQTPPSSGPVITSATAATGRVGQPFTFNVIADRLTPAARLSTANLPSGLIIDAVSGVITGTPAAAGSFLVNLTVTDGGFATAATLQLTITPDTTVPVIVSPGGATLVPGESFTYTINAPTIDPSDPTVYDYLGTLPAGLTFDAKTGTISGIYEGQPASVGPGEEKTFTGGALLGQIQLFATNSRGTATFQLLFLRPASGAVNIATRTTVGTGDNVLIGGFIITGNAPKVIVIRAIGPSTGIAAALQDPTLEVHNQAGEVLKNDDWRSNQEKLILESGFQPGDDRESALLVSLEPGNYTAIVGGKDGSNGIALVELYDLGTASDSMDGSVQAQLAQISTRGNVLTGDNILIGGFTIRGAPTKIIVRAIGPSLNSVLPGTLQDPTVELRDKNGSLITANDDWRSGQEQQIIDTTVPPSHDKESAIVATLNPDPYTALVRGKNDSTGVALVEVYGLK